MFFTSGGSESVETAGQARPAVLGRARQAREADHRVARAQLPRDGSARHVAGWDPAQQGGLRDAGRGCRHSSASTTSTPSNRCSPRGRARSPRSSPSRSSAPAGSSRREDGYFAGLQQLCRQFDVLLIADEVITGFGRPGRLVGEHALRHRAGHDHVRQGRHLRATCRSAGSWSDHASGRRSGTSAIPGRRLPPRLHVLRPRGGLRGSDGQPRHHRARGPARAASRTLRAGGGARARPAGRIAARGRGPDGGPHRRGRAGRPRLRAANPGAVDAVVAASRRHGVLTRNIRGVGPAVLAGVRDQRGRDRPDRRGFDAALRDVARA